MEVPTTMHRIQWPCNWPLLNEDHQPQTGIQRFLLYLNHSKGITQTQVECNRMAPHQPKSLIFISPPLEDTLE